MYLSDSFKKRESIVAIFDKDFQGDFFFTMKESFVKEKERKIRGLRHPKIKYRKIKHREKSD